MMLNSRKGQRERCFYELINGDATPNEYFKTKRYSCETLAILKKLTPIYKGLVAFAQHPEGIMYSVIL